MQVIRLARGGRKKYPVYRIVSADKARAVSGKFINVLGTYNPHTKELILKKEELAEAINHGAQPSNAVLKLMQKNGMTLPKWAEIKTRDRKPKKTEEVAAESPKATKPSTDQVEDASANEVPASEETTAAKSDDSADKAAANVDKSTESETPAETTAE